MIANTRKLKSGKTLPVQMNPVFCCDTLLADSEFGINSMNPRVHHAWSQQYMLLVVKWCGSVFISHIEPDLQRSQIKSTKLHVHADRLHILLICALQVTNNG